MNDMLAHMTSLAEKRNRNIEVAKKMITESISLTAKEALEQNIIDFVAQSRAELLEKIDNFEIEKNGNKIVLQTENIEIVTLKMNFIERFFYHISNPNIAYILLMLGIYGILAEFSSPGIGFAGVFGTISLLLAFFALSSLPVNLVGILLIAAGVILLLLEIKVQSSGILGIGGVVGIILGSMMLIQTGSPFFKISISLIIGVGVFTILFFLLLASLVYQVHRKKVTTGRKGLIGEKGYAKTTLKPEGTVFVRGELWQAESIDGNIKKDEKIQVVKIEHLKLFLLSLIVLLACQSMYMRTAKLAIRDENDPDKAIEYLQKEINKNPTNVEAYLFMSKIYGQKKDYIKSYNYAQKALELDPQKQDEINKINLTCWAELYNQGLKYYNEKDFKNSLKSFKSAVKIFPDSLKSKIMLANVYAKVDSSKKAIKIFTEIAEKLPNDVASRKTLANMYFSKKEYENAIKYFEELSEIEPQNVDWPYNIAVCYSNLNNPEKVLEYYKKAAEIKPNDIELLYKIADDYFNNQNYEEASNYYLRIIEINDKELDAIKYICYSFSNSRDYENLVKYAKKWVDLEPENKNSYRFVILGLQQTGQDKESQKYIKELEELENK